MTVYLVGAGRLVRSTVVVACGAALRCARPVPAGVEVRA